MYVIGERNNHISTHIINPDGPDPEKVAIVQPINDLSFHKTLCGMHYGSDRIAEVPAHLDLCEECEKKQ